jgi:hypothetical protein
VRLAAPLAQQRPSVLDVDAQLPINRQKVFQGSDYVDSARMSQIPFSVYDFFVRMQDDGTLQILDKERALLASFVDA